VKKSLAVSFSIAVLLSMGCRHISEDSTEKFDSGEHTLIGQKGYESACRKASCLPLISRKDKKMDFTYGELVAFSGDFYETPSALDSDTGTGLSFLGRNNLKKGKQIIEEEIKQIDKQKHGVTAEDSKYLDSTFQWILAFPSVYLSVSANNYAHFGWYNIKEYVFHHQAALDAALKGFKSTDPDTKNEFFREALLKNSFADHFLTDGFASGHIRNPRTQSISWDKKKGCSIDRDGSLRIGLIAKVLHDNDHTFEKTGGLKVVNARGDTWSTRSDGDLFIKWDETSPHYSLPVEAVALSVTEVLEAFRGGIYPRSTFKALHLVPFVDPTEKTLVETFAKDTSEADITAMLESQVGSAWLKNSLVCLDNKSLRAYFTDLPMLMKNFRSDVAADVEKDPNLTKRLTKAYIDGFKAVQ